MELTSADIHNVLVFISRAQMTGSEAPTYLMLCEKLKTIAAEKDAAKSEEVN